MTWTYDPAQLATSPTYQVRFLIGDTESDDPQLQDEEIAFSLTQFSSSYRAAAQCCRTISSNLSRKADTTTVELRTSYSQLAKNYAARAAEYDNLATTQNAGLPFAGGVSVSDKRAQEGNPDRVRPQFNIGMEDNWLPDGIAGNEVESR